ncbi:hypothetical protein [Flavobacterium phage 2A]|uniref:Uncharacterized protein n=1 Tax=Flavobacterium phage 2A TaxID=1792273 RepID=A0A1B0WN89_9CAUD|nr:hypothetical protein BOX10_gp47 [Flavobacterium phage 2A]ANB40958.1 hypothetical protein [Flavobacterium phage 2A]
MEFESYLYLMYIHNFDFSYRKAPRHNNFFAMIFGLVYKFKVGCVFVLLGALSEAWFCTTPKNLAKNKRYAQALHFRFQRKFTL